MVRISSGHIGHPCLRNLKSNRHETQTIPAWHLHHLGIHIHLNHVVAVDGDILVDGEDEMKESDFAFLLANIFLASFIGQRSAMFTWVVYMGLFGTFLYLGR